MKKQEIFSQEISKLFGIKPTCLPYFFLEILIHGERSQKPILVSDILKQEPSLIAKKITEFNVYSDRKRNIRKTLHDIHHKLQKMKVTEKDGCFMKGIYFVTIFSERKSWITFLKTERGLTTKEASTLYDLAKKAHLNFSGTLY
jgi:hypothetical protein